MSDRIEEMENFCSCGCGHPVRKMPPLFSNIGELIARIDIALTRIEGTLERLTHQKEREEALAKERDELKKKLQALDDYIESCLV